MSKLNKNILNEINRYREIVGLPIIDEQRRKNNKSESFSWGNGGSGRVNLGNKERTPGKLSIADNIGRANLSLYYGGKVSSVQPQSKTEDKIITMPSFTLEGGDLNYDDNCVLPKIEGQAKEKFETIISSFVNYIKNGGFDKIDSIIIQGSADSGTPTLSGNDHINAGYSKPFNGETDKFKMNQFLADERAKQYGLLINKRVKEETEKELISKYQYKNGINHWTKEGNPSKRGEQFRSITFNVNAPELKVADKVETTTTVTPVDEKHEPVTLIVTKPDGSEVTKQGIRFINDVGEKTKIRVQGFYPDDKSLLELVKIPSEVVNGEIDGNVLKLDGKSICTFYSTNDPNRESPSYTCKVTGYKGQEREGIVLVKDYEFTLK